MGALGLVFDWDVVFQKIIVQICIFGPGVKLLQDCWGAAFVYDWQPPLIFVWFTINFCGTIGAHAQEVWGKLDND